VITPGVQKKRKKSSLADLFMFKSSWLTGDFSCSGGFQQLFAELLKKLRLNPVFSKSQTFVEKASI
jgi:hypothetical protein